MPQRQLARPTSPRWGVAPLPFQLCPIKTFAVVNCCLFSCVPGKPPSLAGNAVYQLAPYLRGANWQWGNVYLYMTSSSIFYGKGCVCRTLCGSFCNGELYGAQTVGRKTSWAKDVWANYFVGDRRLGDKLGRYGDSKSDGWATFFRRLGEMCERGETQN